MEFSEWLKGSMAANLFSLVSAVGTVAATGLALYLSMKATRVASAEARRRSHVAAASVVPLLDDAIKRLEALSLALEKAVCMSDQDLLRIAQLGGVENPLTVAVQGACTVVQAGFALPNFEVISALIPLDERCATDISLACSKVERLRDNIMRPGSTDLNTVKGYASVVGEVIQLLRRARSTCANTISGLPASP